jgi:hypothetical protein
MSDKRKVFDENSSSKTAQLYKNINIDNLPTVKLSKNQEITFKDIQQAILSRTDFISVKHSSVTLNEDLTNDVKETYKEMNFVPETNEAGIIQISLLQKQEGVDFYHGETHKGIYYPPRMIINVGDVNPNSSVRINTGYVFYMPRISNADIKDGKLIQTNPRIQPSFIVIPHIICDNNSDFIPTVCARDPEDSGFFFTTANTRSGKIGKLKVILKAYKTFIPSSQLRIVDAEQQNVQIFKPKIRIMRD